MLNKTIGKVIRGKTFITLCKYTKKILKQKMNPLLPDLGNRPVLPSLPTNPEVEIVGLVGTMRSKSSNWFFDHKKMN